METEQEESIDVKVFCEDCNTEMNYNMEKTRIDKIIIKAGCLNKSCSNHSVVRVEIK